MFIRELEKGECQECKRCRTAAWFEYEHCHKEFIVHGVYNRVKTSYCSTDCSKRGGEAAILKAKEGVKRFMRIKYGPNRRIYEKPAYQST